MFVPSCFLWASNEGLYPPATPSFIAVSLSLFFFFACSIPVSALRCHKRSYSLWFTLRFLRDGPGTPKRTMLLLVLLKEYIFTRHQGVGIRKDGLFDYTTFVPTLWEIIISIYWYTVSLGDERRFGEKAHVCVLNSLHSFTSHHLLQYFLSDP